MASSLTTATKSESKHSPLHNFGLDSSILARLSTGISSVVGLPHKSCK